MPCPSLSYILPLSDRPIWLATASPLVALMIDPTGYFLPGLLPLATWLALPASVLAAVIERPFVTQAGVVRHALWYSLQANFVALVVGAVVLPVTATVYFAVGLLGLLPPVALAVLVKAVYYRWRAPRDSQLRWCPLVWGNLLSGLVLFPLPLIAEAINRSWPLGLWKVHPYRDSLCDGAVAASLGAFMLGFIMPILLRKNESPPPDSTLPSDAPAAAASDHPLPPEPAS